MTRGREEHTGVEREGHAARRRGFFARGTLAHERCAPAAADGQDAPIPRRACYLLPMAPHDVEPAATPRPDLNSPEALRAATERLRALGIDDEVVFSCTSADDLAAHLGIDPAPCASAT